MACCVARGTRVATPDGGKAVEDFVEGDPLLCVDAETGEVRSSRVVALRTGRRECVRLRFGARSLTCTSDHPLYSPERRAFVPAGAWIFEGLTSILLVEEGRARMAKVSGADVYAGVFDVLDVSVEDEVHTFVAEGVVVHNKSYAAYFETQSVGPAVELSAAIPERAFELHTCLASNADYEPLDAQAGAVAQVSSMDNPPARTRVGMSMLVVGEDEGFFDDDVVGGSPGILTPIDVRACDDGFVLTLSYADPVGPETLQVAFTAILRADVKYYGGATSISIDEL